MIRIGKIRVCSCCGSDYREWKDQDIEGNNCPRCTVWVLRDVVKNYHKSIDLLCTRLSDHNVKRIRRMSFLQQRVIVEKAFADGILSYKI